MVKTVVMEDKQGQKIRPIKRIENKRALRVAYKNRKDCILKKTMELATLCCIKACTVCFGPNGEVETWPENQSEVRAMIKMYKESGKNGRGRKVSESSSDCSDEKVAEIAAAKKDDSKKALLGWDDGWLHRLSTESMINFLGQLESKLEVLTTRIEFLKMANGQNRALQLGKEEPCWFDDTSAIDNFDMDYLDYLMTD